MAQPATKVQHSRNVAIIIQVTELITQHINASSTQGIYHQSNTSSRPLRVLFIASQLGTEFAKEETDLSVSATKHPQALLTFDFAVQVDLDAQDPTGIRKLIAVVWRAKYRYQSILGEKFISLVH